MITISCKINILKFGKKFNKDTINVGLDYSYIIAMPGYDLEPNTGDEVKYKYITTRIRKVKFENVVLEK